VKLRFIDWIWRVKGTLDIEPSQTAAEAFGRLDRLFQADGTTRRINGDTLIFTKKGQRPQDKMSIFDGGTLRITDGALRYDMTSRALLACFVAPLFFFIVGHVGVAVDQWRNPPDVVAAKEKAAKKRTLVKAEEVPMNPVDAFLGAPKSEKKKDGESIGKKNRKPTMTTAYVFMGIFFALWILGRILEHRLIHSRFRCELAGNETCTRVVVEGWN
jgi:hypothetical protein